MFTDLALFRRERRLTARMPRIAIAALPTPVEQVHVRVHGADHVVLVKRDDICAEGYAGNKVRKLEFLLAEAMSRQAGRLVTAGATGSHHAFATAYHGRRLGFDVSLVLFPQKLTPHVRDMLLLDHAVGADLCWASRMETVPWGMWRERFRHRGQAACIIPPGGSSVTGTLGYVNGALELAEQVESGAAPRPSSVYVAAGTLGTVAGIAIGLAWSGLDVPVIATRITSRIVTNERVLAALVRETVARLAAAGATVPDAAAALRLIDMRHDQIGPGYGRTTNAAEEASRVFAEVGLRLDVTYTAKSAASLLDDFANARPANAAGRVAGAGAGPPLFWHTLSAVEPRDLLADVSTAGMPPRFARYLDGA
jgi:D-cysteine desulfhydrase